MNRIVLFVRSGTSIWRFQVVTDDFVSDLHAAIERAHGIPQLDQHLSLDGGLEDGLDETRETLNPGTSFRSLGITHGANLRLRIAAHSPTVTKSQNQPDDDDPHVTPVPSGSNSDPQNQNGASATDGLRSNYIGGNLREEPVDVEADVRGGSTTSAPPIGDHSFRSELSGLREEETSPFSTHMGYGGLGLQVPSVLLHNTDESERFRRTYSFAWGLRCLAVFDGTVLLFRFMTPETSSSIIGNWAAFLLWGPLSAYRAFWRFEIAWIYVYQFYLFLRLLVDITLLSEGYHLTVLSMVVQLWLLRLVFLFLRRATTAHTATERTALTKGVTPWGQRVCSYPTNYY